jgi:hypothetical protein
MKTKTTNLPQVEFEYPDSETGLLKLRYVNVIEVSHAYIKGYELPHPLATTETGKYKLYRMAKIARNGVILRHFQLTPQ